MHRCLSVTVLLLCSCLGVSLTTAATASRGELEQQLLAHLNERMYNACKSVVLTRETEDGYEGFVLFANGRRKDVQVAIVNGKIEYKFIGRTYSDEVLRPPAEANAPGASLKPPAAATPDHVYTQQSYRRIEKGMPYARVADIVGGPGIRISSSYFDGAVNEVWIWANPDDSHLCVVFRDGVVLVRTASGLPQTSEEAGPQHTEADYFDSWLLAWKIDGRIVPLDLSFGQWLTRVRDAAAKTSGSPRIDVAEENDRLVVELLRGDAESAAGETRVYLTCVPVQELGPDAPEAATAEKVCIPMGIRVDGRQEDDPARAWELMRTLAGPTGL